MGSESQLQSCQEKKLAKKDVKNKCLVYDKLNAEDGGKFFINLRYTNVDGTIFRSHDFRPRSKFFDQCRFDLIGGLFLVNPDKG